MTKASILLALSGSEQSRNAAELCWELAQRTKMRVLAQTVVDSRTSWELIGQDSPGFLGTSMYTTAYDALCQTEHSLAEKLIRAYRSAAPASVDTDAVIDEGDPIKEICRRALTHSLVVMGHRPKPSESSDDGHHSFQRVSVAEGLAHDCPRPLLVIQQDCKLWTTMKIVLSLEHINELYITSAMSLAVITGCRPEIFCLATGVREEPPAQVVEDLQQANPLLADLSISVVRDTELVSGGSSYANLLNMDIESGRSPSTLLVIPTREIEGRRVTVLGTPADRFVRYLKSPSILLWPEEYLFEFGATKQGAKSQAAKV